MRLVYYFLLAMSLIDCKSVDKKPDPIPATPTISSRFLDGVDRVEQHFLDRGWIVSRSQDGSIEHLGDSLLWSGIYLASSTCEATKETAETLQGMIQSLHGQLIRFDPLGEYEDRPISLDGAIGLYFGIAWQISYCPDSRESWARVLELHKGFVEANHGRLNANSDVGIDAFDYVLDLLLDRLSGDSDSSYHADRRDTLVALLNSWSLGVKAGYYLWKTHVLKDPPAAYRVHLSLLTLQTIEMLGVEISDSARLRFCNATTEMDLPTTDHYCGRGNLVGWIDGFEFDQWEFRHQRAALWEDPDGNGYATPGLDLLRAMRQQYAIDP